MPEPTSRVNSREVIDDAAVQLIAVHGLEAVSVRKVAGQAGVSAGLVQHHYPTKQALLLVAMQRVETSVQQRLRTIDGDRPAGEQLRALSRQILPLDAERVAEARVWLAFVARAAVDPAIAAIHAESWRRLENAIAVLVATHHERSCPGRPDQDQAALLLAGLDGLATAAVSEPARLPPPRLLRLADRLVSHALS